MTFKCNLYKKNNVFLHLGGIGLAHNTDMSQQCTKYRPHCNILVQFLIKYLVKLVFLVALGATQITRRPITTMQQVVVSCTVCMRIVKENGAVLSAFKVTVPQDYPHRLKGATLLSKKKEQHVGQCNSQLHYANSQKIIVFSKIRKHRGAQVQHCTFLFF